MTRTEYPVYLPTIFLDLVGDWGGDPTYHPVRNIELPPAEEPAPLEEPDLTGELLV